MTVEFFEVALILIGVPLTIGSACSVVAVVFASVAMGRNEPRGLASMSLALGIVGFVGLFSPFFLSWP